MSEALCMLVNLASSALSRSLSSLSSSKSHPSFDDGAVGLAIVAAMVTEESPSPPLPIFSAPPAIISNNIPNWEQELSQEDEESSEEEEDKGSEMMEEMWESYTCVTWYMGGKLVRKTVYLEEEEEDGGNSFTTFNFDNIIVPPPSPFSNSSSKVVFFVGTPPQPPPLPAHGDFMRSCFLCHKNLHRLDIFMYRGEKPFCSPECRYQYVLNDDNPESCGSEVLDLLDCALVHSTPRPLGMTAA